MITEIHVKGATMLNPNVPEELRGTYLGLCHDSMIEFFKASGIDKLQLMPVFEFDDEQHLIRKGLPNFWGYNPRNWMYPTERYAKDKFNAMDEFNQMVRKFHQNGIKVIVDVVYNHIAELERHTLPHWGRNYCGCGDTVNLSRCKEKVMLSLRAWKLFYGVDGFRFDLAPALGRDGHGAFNPNSELLQEIMQDNVLSDAILIAEPWDCETYQLGKFPSRWQECTDQYRQHVREFFKGTNSARNLAEVLAGSQNTFKDWQNKRPVNYVTYHDGFTLHDLVRYDEKQNWANKEGNHDGCDNNANWSRWLPGDTPEQTEERREAAKVNMMTCLLFSLGEPHVCFGDFFSHSQGGNNNAYCQDNETSWINWDFSEPRKAAFYNVMCELVHEHHRIMPAFNDAVGNGLVYDWHCDNWDSDAFALELHTGDKTLVYKVNNSDIYVKANF